MENLVVVEQRTPRDRAHRVQDSLGSRHPRAVRIDLRSFPVLRCEQLSCAALGAIVQVDEHGEERAAVEIDKCRAIGVRRKVPTRRVPVQQQM